MPPGVAHQHTGAWDAAMPQLLAEWNLDDRAVVRSKRLTEDIVEFVVSAPCARQPLVTPDEIGDMLEDAIIDARRHTRDFEKPFAVRAECVGNILLDLRERCMGCEDPSTASVGALQLGMFHVSRHMIAFALGMRLVDIAEPDKHMNTILSCGIVEAGQLLASAGRVGVAPSTAVELLQGARSKLSVFPDNVLTKLNYRIGRLLFAVQHNLLAE